MSYRTLDPAVRAAWLAYKESYSGAGKPNLVSFVAGYNAQKEIKVVWVIKHESDYEGFQIVGISSTKELAISTAREYIQSKPELKRLKERAGEDGLPCWCPMNECIYIDEHDLVTA